MSCLSQWLTHQHCTTSHLGVVQIAWLHSSFFALTFLSSSSHSFPEPLPFKDIENFPDEKHWGSHRPTSRLSKCVCLLCISRPEQKQKQPSHSFTVHSSGVLHGSEDFRLPISNIGVHTLTHATQGTIAAPGSSQQWSMNTFIFLCATVYMYIP